jgi:hypothetical protein
VPELRGVLELPELYARYATGRSHTTYTHLMSDEVWVSYLAPNAKKIK